jgi:hypothetical protein
MDLKDCKTLKVTIIINWIIFLNKLIINSKKYI